MKTVLNFTNSRSSTVQYSTDKTASYLGSYFLLDFFLLTKQD